MNITMSPNQLEEYITKFDPFQNPPEDIRSEIVTDLYTQLIWCNEVNNARPQQTNSKNN